MWWQTTVRRESSLVRQISSRLDRELSSVSRRHVAKARRRMRRHPDDPKNLLRILSELADGRRSALAATSLSRLHAVLIDHRRRLVEALASMGPDHAASQPVLEALAVAELAIATARGSLPNRQAAATVIVPSVLLLEVNQRLMPPERMLMIAGRHSGSELAWCAAFDVTASDSSRVHVRADGDRMRAALLAMEASGTVLAAWVHSHPGTGIGATVPSAIDARQAADWDRDFPGLLAAITTADRWWRFWGPPTAGPDCPIRIEGTGCERVKEYVYRLG